MAKNIVFCADGTWNSPGQDDNHDQIPDPTNVCKLFLLLTGELSPESLNAADEQEKVLTSEGSVRQVAKYLHGVGDSRNPIRRMMGGAFGAGIVARIVRGYTFISRNYQPGDRIYLAGFSRGAYTARALAGFIAKQGLLAPELTQDREEAYRRGAEAWYRYRKSALKRNLVTSLAEIAADLPAFLSSKRLKDGDFVAVERIGAVAVWDTVGALGIPCFEGDRRMDAFRFTDTKLSPVVSWGFHAVSLDEQRCDFTPTLWSARPQVRQVLFPGAHADVGGGYSTANNESDLSDLALEWMVEELRAVGVEFGAKPLSHFNPACGGTAHEPWRGSLFKTGLRSFPKELIGHHAIALRAKLPEVLADPKASPAPYQPKNMPKNVCISGFNADAPATSGICATCVLQD
jgi:uncharacterized protein (DUF2235 family)